MITGSCGYRLKRRVGLLSMVVLLEGCGGGSSGSDANEVRVGVEPTPGANTAPVANAGVDQNVAVGMAVTLNGGASRDVDGDPLTYNWSLISVPSGSSAGLHNASSTSAGFTPDIAGSYVVSLMVSDGKVNSASDQLTVTVISIGGNITNAEFVNRAGSCQDYVGTYFANVSDIKRGVAFNGNLTISMNGDSCRFSANEIPNHDFNDDTASFATNVSEQDGAYQVAANPVMATGTTARSLGTTNALLRNGVVVDLLAAACYDVGNEPLGREKIGCGDNQIDNPWRYDPMSPLNSFGTDAHNAHTQPDGTYHYHGSPLAMYNLDCEATGVASPVIGFAADGFPVYGPCFSDPADGVVRKATSSFVLRDNGGLRRAVAGFTTPTAGVGDINSSNYDGQFIGDYEYRGGAGDLDECNGMTVDNQYGYYLTDAYPWVLACYKGKPDSSFNKTGPALMNRMHGHVDARAHSH